MTAAGRRPGTARRTMAVRGKGLALFDLRQLPLVGRTEERDQLWAELATVHRERTPRSVVIRGPAGVGKSRLCLQMTDEAAEAGFEVCVVPCPPHGSSIPLGGSRSLLAALVGVPVLSSSLAESPDCEPRATS